MRSLIFSALMLVSFPVSAQCVGGACYKAPVYPQRVVMPRVVYQPMQLRGVRYEVRHGWYPGWFFGRPRPVYSVPVYEPVQQQQPQVQQQQ